MKHMLITIGLIYKVYYYRIIFIKKEAAQKSEQMKWHLTFEKA